MHPTFTVSALENIPSHIENWNPDVIVSLFASGYVKNIIDINTQHHKVDIGQYDTLQKAEKVVADLIQISKTLENKKVLVHCHQGAARSPAARIVLELAYIFHKNGTISQDDLDLVCDDLFLSNPKAKPDVRILRSADTALNLNGKLSSYKF